MKNAMLLCTLFAALAVSVGARAADTAELQVKGSVRPAACALTLSAEGVVDYGRIPASRLSDTKITSLGGKSVQYSITCPNGAARVALQLMDNRKSSVVKGMAFDVTQYFGDYIAYGLGIVNGKTIGIYMLIADTDVKVNTADGNGSRYLNYSSNAGQSWRVAGGGQLHLASGNLFSWATATASPDPVAVNSVSGTLTVVAFIDKLGNIPAGNDIPLDGLTTLEMRYL